ncbi:ATP-binding cassette domain-containing protein [Streptomyces iakyrus]|uniref:ATP-binding cassette domain-containing protein n=1 Tax=Streptomyces iakyrus TaxID=68219 RepID=UPI000526D7E2
MSDAAVVCSNLSFSWPDDTPVFSDLSFTVTTGRTGLVAPNGAGKSTLLKLIAGELQPSTGSLPVAGTLGHLPQSLPLTGDLTVAEVLGVAAVIRALDAVESGDVSEEHFTVIGDDWDVEERTRAQLDRLGLAGLALDRSLSTLSGGQVVALGLAAQLLRRPDVLLLDEPTNNLDLVSARQLESALNSYRGAFMVISYDERFLAEIGVDRRLRLADGTLTEAGVPGV